MNEYIITITETRSKMIVVRATSHSAAKDKVERDYKFGDIILEDCDRNDVIFEETK